jgi:hypothetical protein
VQGPVTRVSGRSSRRLAVGVAAVLGLVVLATGGHRAYVALEATRSPSRRAPEAADRRDALLLEGRPPALAQASGREGSGEPAGRLIPLVVEYADGTPPKTFQGVLKLADGNVVTVDSRGPPPQLSSDLLPPRQAPPVVEALDVDSMSCETDECSFEVTESVGRLVVPLPTDEVILCTDAATGEPVEAWARPSQSNQDHPTTVLDEAVTRADSAGRMVILMRRRSSEWTVWGPAHAAQRVRLTRGSRDTHRVRLAPGGALRLTFVNWSQGYVPPVRLRRQEDGTSSLIGYLEGTRDIVVHGVSPGAYEVVVAQATERGVPVLVAAGSEARVVLPAPSNSERVTLQGAITCERLGCAGGETPKLIVRGVEHATRDVRVVGELTPKGDSYDYDVTLPMRGRFAITIGSWWAHAIASEQRTTVNATLQGAAPLVVRLVEDETSAPVAAEGAIAYRSFSSREECLEFARQAEGYLTFDAGACVLGRWVLVRSESEGLAADLVAVERISDGPLEVLVRLKRPGTLRVDASRIAGSESLDEIGVEIELRGGIAGVRDGFEFAEDAQCSIGGLSPGSWRITVKRHDGGVIASGDVEVRSRAESTFAVPGK